MNPRNILFTLALSLLVGSASLPVQAQPGTSIQEATVSTDIVTLFTRAAQVYPTLFAGGTGWYSYSGYTYKYFPAGGIYAGVKDGQVYLMGGVYGNNPSVQGTVTALSTMLQNAITAAGNGGSTGNTVTADFAGVISTKTVADLPRLFEEMTLDSTTISGNTTITAQTKMQRLSAALVNGVSTEHMLVTLTASNTSSVDKGEIWVDSTGTVRRFILNGFEYTSPTLADSIGKGFVTGFLLTLSAGDTQAVQLATAAALKDTANLSQKVQKRTIGSAEYETLTVAVSTGNVVNYTVEISDFGNVSMATRYDSKIAVVGLNAFKVVSVKFR